MHFDKRWSAPRGAGAINRQAVRPENFAFTLNDVLFIGINKVGGKVHDANEWETRMQQNAEWVSEQLEANRDQTHSAVIFAQASGYSKIGAFQEFLSQVGPTYGKPILYLHADGHNWINERGKYAPNITRVQLDVVNEAFPPIQVQVTGHADQPFVFDRRLDDPKWRIPQ